MSTLLDEYIPDVLEYCRDDEVMAAKVRAIVQEILNEGTYDNPSEVAHIAMLAASMALVG